MGDSAPPPESPRESPSERARETLPAMSPKSKSSMCLGRSSQIANQGEYGGLGPFDRSTNTRGGVVRGQNLPSRPAAAHPNRQRQLVAATVQEPEDGVNPLAMVAATTLPAVPPLPPVCVSPRKEHKRFRKELGREDKEKMKENDGPGGGGSTSVTSTTNDDAQSAGSPEECRRAQRISSPGTVAGLATPRQFTSCAISRKSLPLESFAS